MGGIQGINFMSGPNNFVLLSQGKKSLPENIFCIQKWPSENLVEWGSENLCFDELQNSLPPPLSKLTGLYRMFSVIRII